MRLVTWHLANAIGRLVAPAPRGQRTRTLIVPIGDGSHLQPLAGSWRTEVFGIEPSPAMAQRASSSAARVLCCAFQDARLGHGGWSGVVIELPDPPAASDADSLDRHDFRISGWIRRAVTALAPGGVFLGLGRAETFTRAVAYTLETYLAPLHVFSAQEAGTAVLVVLGLASRGPAQKRAVHHQTPLADRAQPLYRATAALATLPAAPEKPPVFAAASLTWEQATTEAAKHGVWADPAFAHQLRAGRPWDLHPLMPLSRGHLGQLIAAGAFDNVLLTGPDGRPILVKGRTDKIRRSHEDGPARTTREAFRTSVVTFDPASGEFCVLGAGGDPPPQSASMARTLTESSLPRYPGGFPAFFTAYGDALARVVTRQFPPQYALEIPDAWRERAERLARRPFPAQLHAAAAVATRLKRHPAAFLVGEPSTGKTQIALTAAALLDARRILMLGPSYLLPQWADEIRAVLPEARVYTDMTTVRRVREVTDDIAARDGVSIVLLSRDQAKLGYPWRASAIERTVTRAQLDRLATLRRIVPPHVRRTNAVPKIEALGGGDPPEAMYFCHSCGLLLCDVSWKKEPDPADPSEKREVAERLLVWTREHLESGRRRCPHCGEACWQAVRTTSGRAAYPAADYLGKRHPRFFDLLIADEAADYKERDTGQGIALTRLIQASQKTLAQTATLMGGKPSTVFYLLHRLLPAFRRQWAYSQATRFSHEVGLAESTVIEEEHTAVTQSGKLTKRTVHKRSARELPGISPRILQYLLDSTVFLTLRDLGFPMPPYYETAIEIDMRPAQAEAYRELEAALAPSLRSGLKFRRLRALGQALQALLTYPDQPFTGEVITDPHTGDAVAAVPALDPTVRYPKEEELLRLCRGERARGRRVLLYMSHTDHRDMTVRLEALLRDEGFRVAVLKRDTVTTARRAAWVHEHAGSLDALITHPRLVGTGLNIPEFQTVIWYEPEFSAYALRQASRRTWRLGQTKPVHVYFLVYKETAQRAALALVSRKILASLMVEGYAELDSGLAAYDTGGEIFYELAKAILGHARVTDVHDTLRALSASARAQAKLCDPALATRTAALVGAATAAAPAAAPAAPRRRRIAVTGHIATQQTSLFEFGLGPDKQPTGGDL